MSYYDSYRNGKTNWKSPVKKVMELKYDGTCFHCGETIPAGTEAIWSSNGHWNSSKIEHTNKCK